MKEIRFHIDTPSISLSHFSDDNDLKITFQVNEDDFMGYLTFEIDPESIEWDTAYGEIESPKSFDKLIVSLTTKQEISSADFLEIAYILTIQYLDSYFRFIQIELGQYWVDIGPIRHWSLFTFLRKTNAKWIIDGAEREVGVSRGKYSKQKKILISPKRRKYPEWHESLSNRNKSTAKTWIEKHKDVNLENSSALEKLLLSDAKRLLLYSDYKSSAVLAMTVLEHPLESFIKKRCKNKGMTRKNTPTVGKNLQLISSVLEAGELSEWLTSWVEDVIQWHMIKKVKGDQIIDWAINLNQARNKAVHEGKTPDFETLDKGIFAVEAIYEFVKEGN